MAKGLKLVNRVPFIPFVAVLYGLVAGILIVATPQWLFERTLIARGLSSALVGDSARLLSAFIGAITVSVSLWFGMTRLRGVFEPSSVPARGSRIEAEADPQEYTPAFFTRVAEDRIQRPLLAQSDLGAPFMSAEAMFAGEDELILRDVFIEPAPSEPAESHSTVEAAPEPVIEGEAQTTEPYPEFQPEPIWTNTELNEEDSVEDLLDRLEIAIERRADRSGTMPPFGGDVAQLREALGIFSTRH